MDRSIILFVVLAMTVFQDRFNCNGSSIFDKIMNKARPSLKIPEKSESDLMIDFLEDKPWRGPKKRNLKVVYRKWKDSYLERYRTEDDDTIYLYSKSKNPSSEKTTIDEVWEFPWLWTKVKAERLGYINKLFNEVCLKFLPSANSILLSMFYMI